MQKKLTVIVTIAACALAAYVLWNPETDAGMDDDHDHHHSHGHHDDHAGHDHHEGHDSVHLSQEQISMNGIELETAEAGQLQKTLKTPAKLIICKDRIAHIYPKVSGTVVQVNKNLGQLVSANERLASIGSREMAEAKADYLASYNREKLAEGNFQREKNLYEKKISPAQDYHTAKNSKQESLIQLELARQKLHALGLSEQEIDELHTSSSNLLRMYELRSPINGKVIARHITQGEHVNLDHEAFVIADLSTLWVEISLFPQDRPFIREGQQVSISTGDGQTAKAFIVYLSPIIDEETRRGVAIAEIDNRAGKWFPGTFVDADLVTEVIKVPLVIPKHAIQNIEGVSVVFVVSDEGFSVRPVTIGRSDGHQCEIVDGLSTGESYACKNTFLLKAHLQKDEAEHVH